MSAENIQTIGQCILILNVMWCFTYTLNTIIKYGGRKNERKDN